MKRQSRVIAAFLVIGVLGACATPPPPEPKTEWLPDKYYRFENLSKEELFAAAEEVLRLADGNDFTFEILPPEEIISSSASFPTRPDTLLAHRSLKNTGSPFVVEHLWGLNAISRAGGVDAEIRVYEVVQTTPPNRTRLDIENPKLFWQRVEFVLGRSTTWPTCAESRFDMTIALCNPTLLDIDPTTGQASYPGD